MKNSKLISVGKALNKGVCTW